MNYDDHEVKSKIEGGITLEDSISLCKLIEDKCDLINVSAGIHEGPELFIRTHPTSCLPKAANAFLAKAIKESGVKVLISTVGSIGDPDVAEKILEAGEADVIEMRRPLLCDPQLPNKLITGKEDLIVRCLRCNGCFGEHVDFKYGLYEFEEVLERYLALTDAKVVTGVEVTKEIVEKEAPDVLILANGYYFALDI